MAPVQNVVHLTKSDHSEPAFSVIMPSYNYERFLPDAVSSVIGQTLGDFELIIIDDHSTDGSGSIITSLLERDSRVKAIFHQENMGIARTVNDGLEAARGKYVVMMSSDDTLREDILEKLYALFERHEDIGVIIVEAAIIDEKGRKTGKLFSDRQRKPTIRSPNSQGTPRILRVNLFQALLNGNFIASGSFRSKLLREYGISFSNEVRFLNDWLFWLSLASVSDSIYMEDPLYIYRLHKGTNYQHQEESHLEMLKGFDIITHKYANRINRRQKASYTYWKSQFYRDHLGLSKEADLLLFKALSRYPTPTGLATLTKSIPVFWRLFPWFSRISKHFSLFTQRNKKEK